MKAPFIRAALKGHFPSPECAIVFEVAAATGFDAKRRIDAIAMELWPSRGLALHAIEIKVSRSDWRREKATPEKAEELARYCDFFWLAAPKGLIPADEIPMAWGLLEINEAGVAVAKKSAAKTEAIAFGRPFVAALLRAASRPIGEGTFEAILAKREAALESDFTRRVKSEAERLSARQDTDAANWRALIAALDEDPGRFYEEREIIRAVRAVWKSGATRTWSGLESIHKALNDAATKVSAALSDIGVEPVAADKRRRKAS